MLFQQAWGYLSSSKVSTCTIPIFVVLFFFLWLVSRKLISVHMVSVSRDCNCPEEKLVDRFSESSQGILPWLNSSLLPPNYRSHRRGTFTWEYNGQESFTLDAGQRVKRIPSIGIVISSSDPWKSFLVLLSELEMWLNAVVLEDINLKPLWKYKSLG